jgi:glycosyltransferase involved in cell wall biosynthesis
MPVLEAMACGLAVVTTACGGVSNFTHPDLDCLVAETGDVERECSSGLAVDVFIMSEGIDVFSSNSLIVEYFTELSNHLLSILLDDDVSSRLRLEARRTALEWDLDKVSNRLEECLYSATAAGKELLGLRTHPLVAQTTHEVCLEAIAVATAGVQEV